MKIDIPQPTHDKITGIRADLAAERGRNVTYPETIEAIVAYWLATRELIDEPR